MAADVKNKMIERTAVLLAKKGLQGTSFSEILEASGAPRGSLYHHFPGGKNELILAALELAGQRAIAAMAVHRGKPANEVAAAFIGLWREVLTRAHFTAGCAVVAVTVATDDEHALAAASATFAEWQKLLADLFTAGGVAPARALALATNLISACEGAVILARAEKSLAPLDFVASEQLAAITAAMERR